MDDHELLAANLHLIGEREPQITERLFERFFKRYPQAQELFGPHSVAIQEDMLMETLVGAVDSMDGVPWVESNMELLGVKHAKCEINDEMYDWWTKCILETLADISSTDWTPRLAEVWKQQLNHLCTLMRESAGKISCPHDG